MSMQPTFCEDCDNVHPDTRKQSPGRWLCMRFPRLPGLSPVARNAWVATEPYQRCVSINAGFCPLFEPARSAFPSEVE
ncbi:hypothetical protein [Ancylobacter polymorphus]|uniref:Uracil-DNA glycosylase n=1 Tax=Ancylobacter polymorphus TaxID=223390 RepID=A0ABU0BDA7_9HYPH|nr:hypothetical protein [Ancylobacter polymorphus]MDQ0303827.1 hypothetical protein [Ancylobacter polymorphus]